MKEKRRQVHKLLVCMMAFAMTFGVAAFAYGESQNDVQKNFGLLPGNMEPVYLNEHMSGSSGLNHASSLPSRYDARNLSYNKYVKVKNQLSTGTCWACSTMTVAERSWLQEQVNNGITPTSSTALSPLHLAYFTYNKPLDPLGLTNGDRTTIMASGVNWKTMGGNSEIAMLSLSNWIGAANDSVFPLASHNSNSYESIAAGRCYDSNQLIIQNSTMLFSDDAVKSAIMKKGAVVADYLHSSEFLGSDGKSYFIDNYSYNLLVNGEVNETAEPDEGKQLNKALAKTNWNSHSTNHAITIVGWDDNYSRYNFDGEGKYWPSGNGAWIVQNSWGENWGEKGYFYISYYDNSLCNAVSYDMQPKSAYDYNYGYDGNTYAAWLYLQKGQKVANFYTTSGSSQEALEAVGFTNWNTGNSSHSYTIDVYVNARTTADLKASNKVASVSASTTGAGFKTVELPEAITMPKGTNFAVVVTSTGSTTANFAIERSGSMWSGFTEDIRFTCSNPSGKSYVYRGSWSDLASTSSNNYCARIRAFTSIPNYERIYGSTRYETSIKLANRLKSAKGTSKYNTIVVACGNNYPDALAGGYLAYRNGAPLITVNSSTEASVANYIQNNLNSGGRVYILGGTGAVSANFENKVENLGVRPYVTRLGGANRYETNLKILAAAGVNSSYTGDVLICTGTGFADSLSAAAAKKPIVLVGKDINIVQRAFMNNLGSSRAYIIGGTGAVSSGVETEIRYIFPTTTRLAGSTRYETSYKVANTFCTGTRSNVVLAYGKNFPDGLSGGPLAMQLNAPLILVDNSNTSYARRYAAEHGTTWGVVIGGPSLISGSAIKNIL